MGRGLFTRSFGFLCDNLRLWKRRCSLSRLPVPIHRSADATAFYQMADSLWQTEVFIPINTTNEGNFKQVPMATISPKGIPICAKGHSMYYSGHCKDRDRQKWRCPLKVKNADSTCHCSTSHYGRVVYTHSQDNLRLFPKTPRSCPTWKGIYDKRTAAERVFKRQKLDFKLTFF